MLLLRVLDGCRGVFLTVSVCGVCLWSVIVVVFLWFCVFWVVTVFCGLCCNNFCVVCVFVADSGCGCFVWGEHFLLLPFLCRCGVW